jgi:hypothetical protein
LLLLKRRSQTLSRIAGEGKSSRPKCIIADTAYDADAFRQVIADNTPSR